MNWDPSFLSSDPGAACLWARDQGYARVTPAVRADGLDAIASALDAERERVLSTSSEETALTIDELRPEFVRMTGTLRMFAGLLREGSWVRAAIDTAAKDSIGPGHDVRRMLVPLDGAVVVFGASNFPLAYGVCGGDTASALAAGCAVVVKEHPAHPRTGRLIAGIAQRALLGAGLPPLPLLYVVHEDPADHSIAAELVRSRATAAVGFTGSVSGGRAIDKLARERETPIPVFAEMGSVNTVIVTNAAAEHRTGEVADLLAGAILARHGQQCTRPGIVLVPGAERLIGEIRDRIAAAPAREMLAPWIRDSYTRRVEEVAGCEGVTCLVRGGKPRGDRDAAPALFKVDQFRYAKQPSLREEIFGPAAVLVDAGRHMDFLDVPIPRSLTCTVLFDEAREEGSVTDVMLATDFMRCAAGRLIFNGVPTGVRVAHGMVHGGPWPSTNRPDTTAVGPYSIERWCRPVCWQNCPDELLPRELRGGNPEGIVRVVNGVSMRGPVVRGA